MPVPWLGLKCALCAGDCTNSCSVWKVVLGLASGKSNNSNEIALHVHVKETATKWLQSKCMFLQPKWQVCHIGQCLLCFGDLKWQEGEIVDGVTGVLYLLVKRLQMLRDQHAHGCYCSSPVLCAAASKSQWSNVLSAKCLPLPLLPTIITAHGLIQLAMMFLYD